MAKVILICGRLCSGKSTYADQLKAQKNAVLLSVDEMILAIIGHHCGDTHDEYVKRSKGYLFNKSLELIEAGVNVILDWGFWTKEERNNARKFYSDRNKECEIHYIDIDEEKWETLINKRNRSVLAKETSGYYVDDKLLNRFGSIFEKPTIDEIDVLVKKKYKIYEY